MLFPYEQLAQLSTITIVFYDLSSTQLMISKNNSATDMFSMFSAPGKYMFFPARNQKSARNLYPRPNFADLKIFEYVIFGIFFKWEQLELTIRASVSFLCQRWLKLVRSRSGEAPKQAPKIRAPILESGLKNAIFWFDQCTHPVKKSGMGLFMLCNYTLISQIHCALFLRIEHSQYSRVDHS